MGDYYFKLYKSQTPIIEQAIEAAWLTLSSGQARGYCLEMICANFLAGPSLDGTRPEVPLNTLSTLFQFLPGEQQQGFAVVLNAPRTMNQSHGKWSPLRLGQENYAKLANQCYSEISGDVSSAVL